MTDFFDAWPLLQERVASADHLLVMLDFDGTLAPIVPRPEDARIPPATRETLEELARSQQVVLAFVSGREISDVRRLVGIAPAHYFGSHGRQRLRSGDEHVDVDERYSDAVKAACGRLEQELSAIPGFAVENKQVSAAVHYRNVAAGLHDELAAVVRGVIASIPMLRASAGKMVFDITPLDGIDKGTATEQLLKEAGGLALYFGDDTTDEAVFVRLPIDAITVFVGPANADSAARYRVANPEAVGRSLELLVNAVEGLRS